MMFITNGFETYLYNSSGRDCCTAYYDEQREVVRKDPLQVLVFLPSACRGSFYPKFRTYRWDLGRAWSVLYEKPDKIVSL